ncbi:MAG: leucyl aminopeptidase family protein [Pseudomonadota bacterium]
MSPQDLATVDQWLLLLPESPADSVWEALPEGARLKQAAARRAADSPFALRARLDNERHTGVIAGQVADGDDAFTQLTLGRKLVDAIRDDAAGTLAISVVGFDSATSAAIAERILAAALAAGFAMPAYKSKPAAPVLNEIRLLGGDTAIDTARIVAEAAGNNLARWLTTMPPNKLNATNYAEIAEAVAREHGWDYHRYGITDLAELNAGAFLAVAQGNADDSASIVRLRYRPDDANARADVSLVGKGIIFDTGGTNLKPFASMLNMHGDMQGSAVALGTLLAISRMKLPLAVDCWLAITENRTGPDAYKSQDVVTAANGKTIQTIHTDAEGRMALADTLVLASREKPRMIIDYATLTGTCISALTTHYSGIFTNRSDWHPRLKRAGRKSGERVWPFPIGSEFLKLLKSDTADIMQCSVDSAGDHILAASFMSEFVEEDTPWVHIDLSAGHNDEGLGHVSTKATGFGVRYTLGLLMDENILEPAAR